MRAFFFSIVWIALVLSTGCAGPSAAFSGEIEQVLTQQAASWNRGDIDAFVEPYWHSPNLTFSSGGVVTRGWEKTKQRYHERYPSREKMGQLSFSHLEITDLGSNSAMVLGQWHLDRTEPIGGSFTLVLKKMDDRWLIVHDHTSMRGS